MKLFWQDRRGDKQNESLLLTEPAAKLASIEFRNGAYYFKCLGVYDKLAVGTLEDAKTLAAMRLGRILSELVVILNKGNIPDDAASDAGIARNG